MKVLSCKAEAVKPVDTLLSLSYEENSVMNNTIFHHIRNYDEAGILKARGGLTIAFRQHDDNPNVVLIGFAQCSELDTFCKKTGRIKSEGRMNGNKVGHEAGCLRLDFPELREDALQIKEKRLFVTQSVTNHVLRNLNAREH